MCNARGKDALQHLQPRSCQLAELLILGCGQAIELGHDHLHIAPGVRFQKVSLLSLVLDQSLISLWSHPRMAVSYTGIKEWSSEMHCTDESYSCL